MAKNPEEGGGPLGFTKIRGSKKSRVFRTPRESQDSGDGGRDPWFSKKTRIFFVKKKNKKKDSRGPLGAFLGPLKAFLGPLGAFWGCLGAFWDPHERQGDDAGRVAGGAPDSTPRSEGVAPWREVTQHPFKLF